MHFNSCTNYINLNHRSIQKNCYFAPNFESIIFVDRTGVEVYKSNDKYFEWDGGERSPGVYYYYIKYTKSEYKGSVTIVY